MIIIIRPHIIEFLTDPPVRAIAFYPFIVLRAEEDRQVPELINHERIHLRQQAEMLIIFFYLWYFIEYLTRLAVTKQKHQAYKSICFEKEAYDNARSPDYLTKRKAYTFIRYLCR